MSTLDATWTDDCQGKKDYDGVVLEISSRYWPGPGEGGTHAYNTATGVWSVLPYGPMPSATSELFLRFRSKDGSRSGITLAAENFKGETFADVKEQVEAWAQEQMDRAGQALHEAFLPLSEGGPMSAASYDEA